MRALFASLRCVSDTTTRLLSGEEASGTRWPGASNGLSWRTIEKKGTHLVSLCREESRNGPRTSRGSVLLLGQGCLRSGECTDMRRESGTAI